MSAPVVPIFPLPAYFLFPGAASPLRVFEPRYRQMVEDLLDGPGRLVMACIDPQHEQDSAGDPPLLPIGGLGEIAKYRKLPNGEAMMWVVGMGRVRLDEVPADRSYRVTRLDLIDEAILTDPQSTHLRDQVLAAIDVRTEDDLDLEDASLGLLADILAQCVPMSPPALQACFEELDATRRAEFVLAAHETSPR